MNNLSNSSLVQDLLGRRFAQVLEKNSELPYEVSERLRAARIRALSVRRVSQIQLQTAQDIQSQHGLALLKFPTQIHFFFTNLWLHTAFACPHRGSGFYP